MTILQLWSGRRAYSHSSVFVLCLNGCAVGCVCVGCVVLCVSVVCCVVGCVVVGCVVLWCVLFCGVCVLWYMYCGVCVLCCI